MTKASQSLYITQSALSKQMKELEDEFGRPLFFRSSGGMNLTEEGMLLRKRAEDIVSLFEKTKQEFEDLDEITGGDVHVGAPESCHMDIFARELLAFRRNYPGLRCHIISGMTVQVEEMLDRGLLDFIIISGIPNLVSSTVDHHLKSSPGVDTPYFLRVKFIYFICSNVRNVL